MINKYYKILEISPEASPEEIKKAYYRLVRKYSPEKHPEQFQQIREAYETLSDPKSRQNYDSLQEYGDEIKSLFAQVEDHIEAGEWSSAISLLKRIIVLAPSLNVAQNQLGICLTRENKWDEAVKVYSKLTKNNPEIPLYWYNFGQVYKQQAYDLEDKDYNKSQLYQKARQCFEAAINLESINSDYYLEIAQTYFDEDNYYEANIWAEKAIGADGQVDFQDFDTLFFICKIHLYSGDLESIDLTAKRIISLLPDSGDAQRTHAAYKFYNLGLNLVKIGAEQANIVLLRAAFQFFKSARDFDSSDTDIKDMYDRTEEMVAVLEQYEILKHDSEIISGLQKLIVIYIFDAFSLHDSDEVRNQMMDEALGEVDTTNEKYIISSIRRIKSYYPAVYLLGERSFNRIEEIVLGTTQSNNLQSNNPQPNNPQSYNSQSSKTKTSSSSPPKTDEQHSNQTHKTDKTITTPQSSYVSNYPSGSNDWRNAVIIGCLIGGAIIIGFILNRNSPVLLPGEPGGSITTISPGASNPNSALSQEDARNLVLKWQNAKREIFAPPYNRQLASQLITGKLYAETLNSEGSVSWLEKNGAYYQYGLQKIDSVEQFQESGNQAIIELMITESRTLYNQKGGTDKKSTSFDTRLVRYDLQLDNGQWKIAAYKTIKIIRKS